MAKNIAPYAQDLKRRFGITIMEDSDIPVKTPDMSPMNLFGFGYLRLGAHRTTQNV